MAENTAGKQPSRGPGRPFERGQSGNPAGKPRGARHASTIIAEQLMTDDLGDVTRAIITAAKAGDMTAARIILDRLMPVRKGAPVPFDLPRIETAEDVNAALARVAELMAGGTLSPEEAATVAGVIETRRKAIETQELEQRLADIEAKLAQNGRRAA